MNNRGIGELEGTMSLYRSFIASIIFVLLGVSHHCIASMKDLTEGSLREVARIARAISVVQPYLKDSEYIEYGLDIYRAARRYRVEPAVLIAIAQQETNFRNNLPEGAAGEIGICQIRKMWLKHPGFRREFGRVPLRDLHKPARNFLFAAWILRGLKDSVTKRTLPYWSYYNAVRFENRFKYFIAVNRYISALRKNESYFSERAVAATSPGIPNLMPTSGHPYRGQASNSTPESNLESVKMSVARSGPSVSGRGIRRSPGDDAMKLALSRWVPPGRAKEPAVVKKAEPRWIPEAVARLEQAKSQPSQPSIAARRPDLKTDRDFNANLTRAASILDVQEYLPRSGSLQD